MDQYAVVVAGLAGVILGALLQGHGEQRRWLREQRLSVFAELHDAVGQAMDVAWSYSLDTESPRADALARLETARSRLEAVRGRAELLVGDHTRGWVLNLALLLEELRNALRDRSHADFARGWKDELVYPLELTIGREQAFSTAVGAQEHFLEAARLDIGNSVGLRTRAELYFLKRKLTRSVRKAKRKRQESQEASLPL